jgi:hypothetical protein
MPIVIDEFEIVASPPPPAASGDVAASSAQPATSGAATGPRPEDVVRVVERLRQRQARLRAD